MSFKRFAAALLFVFAFAVPILSIAQPSPTASAADECEKRLLGIPPWYRGLTGTYPDCNIKSPTDLTGGTTESDKLRIFITIIAINVIEMAVVVAGYIATFFLLYGGFTFITSGSSSQGVEKARHMMLNAIIGLAIVLGATAILNLISGVLG